MINLPDATEDEREAIVAALQLSMDLFDVATGMVGDRVDLMLCAFRIAIFISEETIKGTPNEAINQGAAELALNDFRESEKK